MKNSDYVDTRFILIVSAIVIMLGFILAGCASVKPKVELKDNPIQIPIKPEVKAVVGVDSSQNVRTDNTVGRDMVTKVSNDSKMIQDLFSKNAEMFSELINTYRAIIVLLIVQLCGLVGAMIKLYRDVNALDEAAEEKRNKMMMDLISTLTTGKNTNGNGGGK